MDEELPGVVKTATLDVDLLAVKMGRHFASMPP
jgi:hypothetical protein